MICNIHHGTMYRIYHNSPIIQKFLTMGSKTCTLQYRIVLFNHFSDLYRAKPINQIQCFSQFINHLRPLSSSLTVTLNVKPGVGGTGYLKRLRQIQVLFLNNFPYSGVLNKCNIAFDIFFYIFVVNHNLFLDWRLIFFQLFDCIVFSGSFFLMK